MYRKHDLELLQDIFGRSSNDIAILYGSADSSLRSIVSDLCKDKESLYYRASAVTEDIQRQLFASELHEQTKSPVLPNEDFGILISSYVGDSAERKKLIVFDEFEHLIRAYPTMINFFANLLYERCPAGSVMLLLVSDDINWIERDMVRMIGKKSSEISAVLKAREYSPTEFSDCFSDMPLKEQIGIYSVIGGRSSYYDNITKNSDTRSVLTDILAKWADERFDQDSFLPKDIREPAIYNTILVLLARGVNKLNDIHNETGIDRAKLSVYLRTLSDHGIVKKCISADVGTGSNTKKGMYVINDRLTYVYYRFVFPNVSSLHILGPERFYRKFIERGIGSVIEDAYPMICMDHINRLRAESRLSFKVASIEEFHDKNDAIDFVIVAAGGSVIACACRYGGPHMSYKRFEEVKTSVRKNKLSCDNIWMISMSGFDQKLTMTGSVDPALNLIDGNDQRLR